MAKLHSTAHATSALYLATSSGLANLSLVMQRFYQECLDRADPKKYFTRSGWTAAGCREGDVDAQRICATKAAKLADEQLDEEIRAQSKTKQKKKAAQKRKPAMRKKPASS